MNENGSMFTKQHHVPCMAHVLDLVVQGGLKELGNPSLTLEYSEGEDDEGCDEDVLEVSSKKYLEKLFVGFENLFLWQIVYLKEFINTRNFVRSIKCQRKTCLSRMFPRGGIRHMT